MTLENRDAAYLWDMLQAARRIPESCRNAHDEIHWRDIIGQRNIIAHEYGQIDYELLYKTAIDDIPVLINDLEVILSSMPDS